MQVEIDDQVSRGYALAGELFEMHAEAGLTGH